MWTSNFLLIAFICLPVPHPNSNNLEFALLLCRAYHYEAYYIETDPAQKDSLFMMGTRLALRLIEQSPAYQQTMARQLQTNSTIYGRPYSVHRAWEPKKRLCCRSGYRANRQTILDA